MAAKARPYEGKDITVSFDAKRCIHAAECVKGLPQVFDSEKRPWIAPDAATADEIASVVQRCPTGALTFARKDGGENEPVPGRNAVHVEADGPLLLRGDFRSEDEGGKVVVQGTRAALCRCGASRNKPFCDGSHTEAGFRDDARVNAVASQTDGGTPAEGPVTIKPLPDGPVILDGSFDVQGVEGTLAFRQGKAALCRCGASKNKPLCDGSHKPAGFRA